ncbi:MAG: N-acetylmuramoyl-L-alanine amidase [Desulfovibrio sp.]
MNSILQQTRRKSTWASFLFITFFLFCTMQPTTAHAISQAALFNQAYDNFHSLKQDKKRSKYRSNWIKIEKKFASVYQKNPKSSYAPKALYYEGRIYEELGYRSGLKDDFIRASEFFGRAISRFPNHSWADDCLFRRAMIRIYRINYTTRGREDLQKIVDKYRKGDMYSKAQVELAKLGGKGKSKTKSSAKITAKKSTSSKKSTASKSSGKVKFSDLAMLKDIRYTSSPEYTRIVLDMDEKANYRYKMLAPREDLGSSHRFYVDIMNSRIGPSIVNNVSVGDGVLKNIRSAQKDKSTTRVVLDFHDMQEYTVFALDHPFRIVIDVFAPGNVAKSTPKKEVKTAKAKEKHLSASSNKAAKRVTGSKNMASDLVEQLGLTIKTIMIDPGHGGKDPGAKGYGIYEKQLNLRAAKYLGKQLQERGFKVYYTRTSDKFISLEDRPAMANAKKVDMFISLHCNAHTLRKINGVETYSLNLARSKDAVRVAARENSIDARRISDLQFILTDLMLNSKLKESTDLSKDVQKNLISSVKKYKVRDHGTREAPFYVLMGAKMPAVLVEMGYITNKKECNRLKDDLYLKHLTRGIADGVVAYKRKIERFAMK